MTSATTPPADLILHNGHILTVDSLFRVVQAVAIRDGKFVAVGRNEEVMALKGPLTQVIDLEGKTATPGIVDSHTHPVGVGRNLRARVKVADINSLQALFDRLSEAQRLASPGEWITTATDWHLGQVARPPELAELDAVAPHNPLWLPMGFYIGFTNSRGLKLAGITAATPDPPGGIVYKDKAGKPTGQLYGTARRLVTDLLPEGDAAADLREAFHYYNSIGVTAVEDDGMDYFIPGTFAAYQALKHSDELSMRCVVTQGISEAMSRDEVLGMVHALSGAGLERGGLGDNMLKVIGLKTVNEHTGTGETLWPREFLREVLLAAAQDKLSVRIHSLCGGTEETLGLYRQVDQQYPVAGLRWAIVHMHFQTPEFIRIVKDLGLVINHELGFAFLAVGPDVWYRQRYGAPRYPDRLIAPVPLYLESGIPFSLNSDAGGANNVSSIWASVYAACNRQKWPGFGDGYSISRKEALKAVTIGGAYRLGIEDRIGSIEVGKLADLAVLSADPLSCTEAELREMTSSITVLEGKIVYESDQIMLAKPKFSVYNGNGLSR